MKKVTLMVLSIALVFGLTACGNRASNATKKSSESESSLNNSIAASSTETKPQYYDETTKIFTYQFASVKINGAQVANGYDGSPIVKVRFTITNKTNQPQKVQELVQTLVSIQQQSNPGVSSELNFGSAGDMDLDPDNLQSIVDPNATVSGYFPYELTNTTNPIVIRYHTAMAVNTVSDQDEIIKTLEVPLSKQ